jgi:gluconolactonase
MKLSTVLSNPLSIPASICQPCLALLCLLLVAPLTQAQNSRLVAAGAAVEQIGSGFAFLEGPVSDTRGNLYFTDINNNRIHQLDANGVLTILRQPSNYANGLNLDLDGALLICEQSGQRLSKLNSDGTVTVIADSFNGLPFNSPNDVWVHRNGSLYFTDPRYNYPEGEPSQPGEYVYLVSKDRSNVSAVITDVPKPNGVIGTEDGAYLYVSSTALLKVFRYDINRDFSVGNRIEFADQGSDGMTLDEHGNLYLTWAGKVSIYSPDGQLIEEIELPESPANVGFGGIDGKTLYMTARTGLYSIRMNVTSSRLLDRVLQYQ